MSRPYLSCPVPGCNRSRRDPSQLMCAGHWFRVPADLRSEVWRAWRSFQRDGITLDELRAVQDQAVASVS